MGAYSLLQIFSVIHPPSDLQALSFISRIINDGLLTTVCFGFASML